MLMSFPGQPWLYACDSSLSFAIHMHRKPFFLLLLLLLLRRLLFALNSCYWSDKQKMSLLLLLICDDDDLSIPSVERRRGGASNSRQMVYCQYLTLLLLDKSFLCTSRRYSTRIELDAS